MRTAPSNWREAFPILAGYSREHFDYAEKRRFSNAECRKNPEIRSSSVTAPNTVRGGYLPLPCIIWLSANDLYKDHDDSDSLAHVNRRVDLPRRLRHLAHDGSSRLFVIRADGRTKALHKRDVMNYLFSDRNQLGLWAPPSRRTR
jgi:hypothetical protein